MAVPRIGIRKDALAINSFIYIFLIAGAITMAVPYIWMLVTSFKPLEEIQAFPLAVLSRASNPWQGR